MAEDEKGSSPKPDPVDIEANEDAETRAARRELKQSSISDAPQPNNDDATGSEKTAAEERPATPADDAENEDLKEQVGSPKKKRAHDQLDSGNKGTQDNDVASDASVDSAKDRTSRSEPEKKRHRDDETSGTKSTTDATTKSTTNASDKPKETVPSAFAASGFSKLATGSSPFASLGAGQTSGFGSSTAPKLASFASPPPDTPQQTPISPTAATSSTAATTTVPAPAAAPKLSFGGTAGASPFAGLSGTKSNGFGGGFGGGATGFGSALGGPKLSGFAAPGISSLPVGKAAKPFGAPDSDAEDDEKEEEAEGDGDATSEAERALSPETDEKKRLKLQKVEVDAGEKNEATIISVRAKMFCHDKDVGWKERGAGMLKVNAPASCVDFDDDGTPIAGSFDASGLDEDDEEGGDGSNKVVRLLMRQDQTHRVILNTVVVPAMKFQEKATLKSVSVLFTAFEGEESKPVSVTMRMSAANAKLFLNEVESIQRELSNR